MFPPSGDTAGTRPGRRAGAPRVSRVSLPAMQTTAMTLTLRRLFLTLFTATALTGLAAAHNTVPAGDPSVGPVQLGDPSVGPVQLGDPSVGPVMLQG